MLAKVIDAIRLFRVAASYLLAAMLLGTGAWAFADEQSSTAAQAKDAQNPVASMISVPFQLNTYFNAGPYRKTEDVLIIEPVLPFKLTENWNLISRWITPLVYQPQIFPWQGSTFGLGNLEPQFYFSPAHPGRFIWGFGPQIWLPTATDKSIGINKLGGGPAFVGLTFQGPWLFGIIANQTWAGRTDNRALPVNTYPGNKVNQALLNPFVLYNKPSGWYFITSPVITAQWSAPGRDVWTVPLGGGIGKIFKVGHQAINARVQVLDNVVRPQYAPTWQAQLQVQLLYPTHH